MVDVDRILGLLDQSYINREVLLKHDEARESFKLPEGKLTVADYKEFNYLLTSYVEHHLKHVGNAPPSPEAAFGQAKRILDREYQQDQFQEGYARALQMAQSGAEGGMRAILNTIAESLKRRALNDYMDNVYYHHIDVLSKEDNLALSHAFYERFGPILKRFGIDVDEDTFAWNTRAALEYHRRAIEQITGIARKI